MAGYTRKRRRYLSGSRAPVAQYSEGVFLGCATGRIEGTAPNAGGGGSNPASGQ